MIKNQKGVTLISLIIYIIILTIILSILAMVSDMFFTNLNYITEKGKYVSEFNKFNMYFINDIKHNENIMEIKYNYIVFDDGTAYTFADNGIYRNKVKICKDIINCTFQKVEKPIEETGNIEKKIIKVEMLIKGSKNLKTSNEYVLKYW